ncbi:hypothetical protein C1H46_030390 [Malus baccata]|uniref:Uncharacterized protein n=1 Tax=Malus baccata TaxID=106549 RepID=A0A540LC62_MALBA|nr:hypothetical protein C1H46_030390 [Malus baccata]
MHFQDEKYLKRAKANTINRSKKKILHHSGSRSFSYRMEEQRQRDRSFLEIDMFKEVYVRPGNELQSRSIPRRQLHLPTSQQPLDLAPPDVDLDDFVL